MSGFIVAYREAAEHPLFKGHADRLGAWLWLLMKAAWKPTKFDVNGKVVTVDRGQLSVSIRHLGDAWGWSKSTTERFLTRLKTETMIETHSGTGRLLITICNYDKYQDISDIHGTASGTRSGTVAGQQRDTKEQGNKGTRDIEPNGSISQRGRANDFPKPDFADDQVWSDFLKNRKTKKLTNTSTAHKRMLDDLAKVSAETGWPPGRVFEVCVAKGWGAIFNPVEKQGNGNGTGFNTNRPEPELNSVAQAALARRAERARGEQELF